MTEAKNFHLKKFPIYQNDLQLERSTSPQTYCESTGRKSAIFGFERGIFEVWVYPFKIVSDLQFTVFIPGYNLVLKGTDLAKRIIVRPEMTTLIFSHDLFTLQEHLLAPLNEPGVIILFDIDTYVPLELWLSFAPNLIPMWPAGLGGQYTLWLDELSAYYIGEGSKKYVGLIGSPFAQKLSNTPGHQLPDEPMKFVVKITPDFAAESFIPLIISGSVDGKGAAVRDFNRLLNSIPEAYQESYDYYQRIRSDFMSIKTPESKIDRAFEWAKISLEKGLVDNPQLGTGLVAGYGVSGKTHRPGFAWFFGGDACYNSLSINGYGDFELTRIALTMLRDHQREDGKIFHEYTQSAGLVKWFEEYPYGFYHAETTAFFIVAMGDYLMRSGDLAFIKASWEAIKKAYRYCLSADQDGDGLMENSAAGLAAMEVGEMLKKNRVDIYLATVWLQALRCMIRMSDILRDHELAETCWQQFQQGYQSFEAIFLDESTQQLSFALLINGDKHGETTIWQALPLFFNLIDGNSIANTMIHLASSDMSTDWGVRGVSRQSQFYDPVSYNTGSVWPFTTGFIATAEYNAHRAINGWHNLVANARMTWLDAPGWHTELLSGEYYRPISTSVPHQLFSAAGIVNPLVSGLLGLESDAITHEMTFAPHMPFNWNEIRVKNFICGEDRFDLLLQKSNHAFKLEVRHVGKQEYQLIFSPAFGLGTEIKKVLVNQKKSDFQLNPTQLDIHCEVRAKLKDHLAIDIQYRRGIEFDIPLPECEIGARSTGLKLIDYHLINGIFTLIVEGRSGMEYQIPIRTDFAIEKIEGGTVHSLPDQRRELRVKFEAQPSSTYLRKHVRLHVSKDDPKK